MRFSIVTVWAFIFCKFLQSDGVAVIAGRGPPLPYAVVPTAGRTVATPLSLIRGVP